ncbi:MAG: Nicotinate-nucleotide adenylyltransferase (EC [uncultured Thiotrichaceae bacterium]|uniref:Probable nicotinate-nucleotide adenylyltransferase n=1 Tax=uncultured Thiotrichaceae bacterium TaxID=298394 RepID=A0A6S6RZ81_9GAMM|nr:MAG: Nicotinate-nucleotide adenylyltransferase (EC [uncultured Thiotrichaceae bacterium]
MIGVYGGSFDPVHFGHLRPVIELADVLALSQVRYVPAKISPFKNKPSVSDEHRLAMLRLALAEFVADDKHFVVDERELSRAGRSYTIDTLREMHHDFPNESLLLIIGADSLIHFHRWKDYERILTYVHLGITVRPSYKIQILEWMSDRWVKSVEQLQAATCGRLLRVNTQPLDISSTQIRTLCAEGKPIEGLVPESVAAYITRNQLYNKQA